MLVAVRRRRPLRAAPIAVLVVGLLAGCAGPDLGRANYQRTTVPAAPGPNTGPGGDQVKTNDPAVAATVLRMVDPCKLVDGAALAELGQPDDADPSGFDTCANRVKDVGGKTIRISLQLGDKLLSSSTGSVGTVQGLALRESKQGSDTCFSTAVTQKEPDLGITAQVTYEGGDPCRSGRIVLDKAIKRLRDLPPRYPEVKGALYGHDPCASVDDSTMTEVLGSGVDKSLSALFSCGWDANGKTATVDFRRGYPLSADYDGAPVDLGSGISGFRKTRSGAGAQCAIKYTHRPVSTEDAEIVAVDYTNYDGKAESDDPCGKVTKVAKNLITKLPRP